MPASHVAVQNYFSRLEKRTDRKLLEFNKVKCKVFPLGRNNHPQQCMLEGNQ